MKICPIKCTCIGLCIYCSELQTDEIPGISYWQRAIIFYAGNLLSWHSSSQQWNAIYRLDIGYNRIKYIKSKSFINMGTLKELNISYNQIMYVRTDTFLGLYLLERIYLTANPLHSIRYAAFRSLLMIETLSLRGMFLEELQLCSFRDMKSLQSLDLSNNLLHFINIQNVLELKYVNVFNICDNDIIGGFDQIVWLKNLKYFYSDQFQFCCYVKFAEICVPDPGNFLGCAPLLSSVAQRLLLCSVVSWTMVTNFIDLILYLHIKRVTVNEQVQAYLIIVGISACIHSFILVAADIIFDANYIAFDLIWRNNLMCFIAELFSFSSTCCRLLLIYVMTWERFRDIALVFKVQPWTIAVRTSLLKVGCLTTVVLCVLASSIERKRAKPVQIMYNSLCLSNFRFFQQNNIGSVFFMILRFFVWTSFAIGHINILIILELSRRNTGKQSQSRNSLWSISICIIMISIVIMVDASEYLLQQVMYRRPAQLRWIIVIALIVHPITNPIMFTPKIYKHILFSKRLRSA